MQLFFKFGKINILILIGTRDYERGHVKKNIQAPTSQFNNYVLHNIIYRCLFAYSYEVSNNKRILRLSKRYKI